jgi:predicted nucleotidyltransferase
MSAQQLDLSEWARRDVAVRDASAALLRRVESKLPELEAILAAHGIGEAYLFGSVAQGNVRPGSDVDIAVSQCPPERFYRLSAQLERALELPLDLIDLDRAPNDFAQHVRTTGRRIRP